MESEARTIERLIPEDVVQGETTGAAALELHLERYRFAADHIRPGRLLDIACGVGYGTHLMTEEAGGKVRAVGVDVSREAIEYARQHYASERIDWTQHDAMTYVNEEGFDSIVSLETIEHVSDPEGLIERLDRLLRPGGVLIASVPTTPSVDVNPYHLHDFTERSFRSIGEARKLSELACLRQVQTFQIAKVLSREESRMENMRQNLPAYYLRHPWSLSRRLWSTLRFGFSNRYLTVVWRKGV